MDKGWKEYLNTVLLGICCFFLANMYSDFKTLIDDVNKIKSTVERHEYILGSKKLTDYNNRQTEDKLICLLCQLEAILPNDKTKIEKDGNTKKV